MATHSQRRRPAHQRTRVDLGVAYGLIGGAGCGAVAMAVTGDVMWVSIGPSLGLLVGLAIASFAASRTDEHEDR